MSSKRRALVGGVILAACLAAPPSPAAADPAPQSASPAPPPAVVDAMERDLGLSEQQVVTRLANEQRAAVAEAALAGRLGGSYGGAWLNDDASKLLVATTDPGSTAAIESQGAQPVVVKRSLAELDAIVQRIDQAPKHARAAVALWYADVKANTVAIQAPTVEAAQALATAAGVAGDAVSVSATGERPTPFIDIVGGAPYYIGSSRCSVGFAVTRGSTPGFVTAGHCGRAGNRTSNPTGTFQGSSFPGNDYAWVAAPGNTPQPWVRGSGGSTVIVRGSTQASVGSSICRSGSTTGWRCGLIQQHNARVTYPQGTVSGLTRTSACAEPGDSGGSFISGNQAQGVTSGGSGNCTFGGTTYHQPVNEILSAYGLTLTRG
ncbi:trypsin-like serine protease [Nonomuraea phyllanthi]|uniref:Trypsin-like serine protease n=1 Tax=Nonomuraea phyllanthi TaxID=2219224 RepID=A0A5C4VVS8_9ACTN|nr:S1 family peptidase [Nonomuraea phyllanthi]KAB8190250.1 trypsin-like serine protease [Nonomuraea phyllanthi]QFY05493.1 trypsin-like serine protease [Nonomuraea phyllanthi]